MSNQIDANWSRWIVASIMKHLEDSIVAKLGTSILIKLEMDHERDKNNTQEWLELRVDGPYLAPYPGEWGLLLEISILVCSLKNEQNVYRHHLIRGVAENALSNSICIKKFGDQPGDDGSNLGPLRTLRVVASYFGQIDVDVAQVQSTVETKGIMELTGV